MKIIPTTTTRSGFTLIELMICMGIMFILLGLTTTNLLGAQRSTSVTSTGESLIANIKSQQIKAMNIANVSRGIHIESSRYILFSGSTYDATAPGNQPVATDAELLSSTFAGSSIIFESLSGQLLNFSPVANTITIKSAGGNEQKILTLNRYGVVIGFQ